MGKQFPIVQFRLALKETARIKVELKPFLVEYKDNNMLFITHTIQQLYTYLTDKNIELHLAFNSLFAVKFIVDNGDFIILTMIEAYLLPKILQIASFELSKQNDNRGDNYFISKGFQGNKDILQYYGFNFVRIACELIMVFAQIKPKKLIYNQEIDQPSDFQIAYRKLKLKGFRPFQTFAFYKEKVIKEARNKFESNLRKYSKDIVALSDHTLAWMKEFLLKGIQSMTKTHPLKLIQKGQATVADVVIQFSVKSLKSTNLKQRRRALKIINEMVKWGLILPYFFINFNKSFHQIIDQVTSLQGKEQKQVGLASLSQYLNNDKEKKAYYNYLLQSIRLWSLCYPQVVNCPHKPSYVKILADRLENTLTQLPKPQKIYIQQAQFAQNQKKRQSLNNYIMRIFLFKSFKQQITKAGKILQQIQWKQTKIQENMSFLNEFQHDYDIKIANSCFNAKDMQYITNYGTPIILTVQKVNPLLKSYSKGNISYKQLKKELVLHNNNLNQISSSHNLDIKEIQSEDVLSSIYSQSEVQIVMEQQKDSKEVQKKQADLKLQRQLQINKTLSKPIANETINQRVEQSQESFRCFQIKRPIQSLKEIYKQEAKAQKKRHSQAFHCNNYTNPQQQFHVNPKIQEAHTKSKHQLSKIQLEPINISLDRTKIRGSDYYQIKDQFTEIISPFIEPQEHSICIQTKVTKANSFMESLLTDQHQIIPQKRESSLKFFNPQKPNALRFPIQKRSRSKSISNKYKEMLRSNESSSRSQTYEILALQSMAGKTQIRSQFSCGEGMKMQEKSTAKAKQFFLSQRSQFDKSRNADQSQGSVMQQLMYWSGNRNNSSQL